MIFLCCAKACKFDLAPFIYFCFCFCSLKHGESLQSCPTLMTLWTVAHQSPLSMGFSRREYWSGLPFPTPQIFPTQGLNPSLLHLLHWQTASSPLVPPGKTILPVVLLKLFSNDWMILAKEKTKNSICPSRSQGQRVTLEVIGTS